MRIDLKTLSEALEIRRETALDELSQALVENDHPKTIDAKVIALGLVEAAEFIANALWVAEVEE